MGFIGTLQPQRGGDQHDVAAAGPLHPPPVQGMINPRPSPRRYSRLPSARTPSTYTSRPTLGRSR